MWHKWGRLLVKTPALTLTLAAILLAWLDSSAQAGFLKHSVKVGDLSAMNLVRVPKPGQLRLTGPKRTRAPAANRTASRSSQDWFWKLHDPKAPASPARWTMALATMKMHRSGGAGLTSEASLRAIAGRYGQHIVAAARAHTLSESLLLAVIAVESAGRKTAVSTKGAQGLMQLIPDTARRFGVADSFDPTQNIDGGAAYLDFLLNAFDGDVILALAGYNAGEGAVEKYDGVPPFPETRDYVVKVLDALAAAQRLCTAASGGPRQPCDLQTGSSS